MRVVLRGLRTRCPRCGEGRLFAHGYRLRDRCDSCALDFDRYARDTWAMIYFSTAGLTGVMIIALIIARPRSLLVARVLLGAAALMLIVLSLPSRKGAAIAVNWLVATRAGGENNGEE